MNKAVARSLLLALIAVAVPALSFGQITKFPHIILVIQENRSPDNFFQGLCVLPFGNSSSCSASPLDRNTTLLRAIGSTNLLQRVSLSRSPAISEWLTTCTTPTRHSYSCTTQARWTAPQRFI